LGCLEPDATKKEVKKMAGTGAISIGVAFVLLGLLNMFNAAGAADLNWIIAGVLAFLAGWFGRNMMK
jgi:hypothetical protein